MYFKHGGLVKAEDAGAEKCAHFAMSFSVSGHSAIKAALSILLLIMNTSYIQSIDPADLPTKSLVV